MEKIVSGDSMTITQCGPAFLVLVFLFELVLNYFRKNTLVTLDSLVVNIKLYVLYSASTWLT